MQVLSTYRAYRMATYTANHLLLTINQVATGASIWSGETASWTLRFSVGGIDRPSLDAGQYNLNTFDVHTANKGRSQTINGVVGTTTQLWEGEAAPPTENVTDNDIDFFFTKGMDLYWAMRASLPSTWNLKNIKLYPVGVDGKSPAGPATWTPDTAVAGSAGSEVTPEIAMAISLYTAHRSKSGRGRMYMGPFAGTIFTSSGLFATSLITTAGTAMKALQDSVRTRGTPATSAVYTGIVWSRLQKTRGATINKVRVGDEPDHQERRTKGRPETYVNSAVV